MVFLQTITKASTANKTTIYQDTSWRLST